MASAPCAPKDPRQNKDLAEVVDPPDYSFTPDDTRGPRTAEIDDEELIRELWDGKTYMNTDRAGPLAILGRFFRPMNGMLQDFQMQTGIPAWTWYRSIELAREETEKFLAEPSFSVIPRLFKGFTKTERQEVQVLFEAEGTSRFDKLVKNVDPKIVAAQRQLKELYHDYFSKAGLTPEDLGALLTDVVPGIRQKDGDYKTWAASRHPPKIAKMLERAIRTGEIQLDDREMDAAVIAKQLFRGIAAEKFMAPSWNLVMTQLKAYADEMPRPMAEVFLRYLHEVRHAPDVVQVGLARAIERVTERVAKHPLFRKLSGGAKLNPEEYRDLVSVLVGFNYQANLAWNPGAVLRQYMQPLQTVAPDVGVNDTMKGIKKALAWYKDESLQKYYEQRGVVTRDVMHERFREIDEVMSKFKPGGAAGQMKDFLDMLRTKGTYAFKKGDDFNRIVAYEAMTQHAGPWAQKFVKGEVDWVTFTKKAKLDRLGPGGGPFWDVVKQRLTAGDVDGGVHEMAREFTRQTQFIYSRGNNPYFMQSTMGRFLGQYGTWPLQYTEYMRNMLVRGSYENRLKALGRWGAINSAMLFGAASVFGVDMSRWTFFSPFGYTGGPFLEMGMQAGSAMNVALGSEDPVDQIQAARLKQNMVTQTVPLPWSSMRHTVEAADRMWNMEPAEAARAFLGLPPSQGR